MSIFHFAIIAMWLIGVGTSIFGLFLAFQASIILGVLVLIIEPSPMILGVLGLLGHTDVAQRIATWLGI